MQAVVSEPTTVSTKSSTFNGQPGWQIMSDAILRDGVISSLDDLLQQALDLWIAQLSPARRWHIAVELYTVEEVSLGRAAEIAGLNYTVFMERLHSEGIPLLTAESTTEAQKTMRKSLIHAGFNLPHP